MNEEMRKEFEKFIFDFLGKDVASYSSQTPNGIDGYVFYDDDSTAVVTIAWLAWQASREAMKPIKLPKEVDANQCKTMEKEILYDGINYGIKQCKEAIEQAGYKVAP